MKKIAKTRKLDGKERLIHFIFICPGCGAEHIIDDRWGFNQDFKKPTISFSFSERGYLGLDKNGESVYGTCHSQIKNGEIEFFSDCTHKLAGKTVDLLDIKYQSLIKDKRNRNNNNLK